MFPPNLGLDQIQFSFKLEILNALILSHKKVKMSSTIFLKKRQYFFKTENVLLYGVVA
jgi:hypothetical protein